MIDWSHVFITAAGAVATIAAMRTDIKWLKLSIAQIEVRLTRLEDRK